MITRRAMGANMGLQAIGIFVGAESITTEAFAALEPDAKGIQIGTMLHQAMAVMCLMGASVGIVLSAGHGFYNMFTTIVAPPLPILLIMCALAVLGFVTAIKARGTSA